MDSELTEEIDKLFEKYTSDLKTRIFKAIIKHDKKAMKDNQKSQKTTVPVSKRSVVSECSEFPSTPVKRRQRKNEIVEISD
jgi:hypothetical protein